MSSILEMGLLRDDQPPLVIRKAEIDHVRSSKSDARNKGINFQSNDSLLIIFFLVQVCHPLCFYYYQVSV